MTDALIDRCRSVVGARHVKTGDRATRRFRKGFRYGDGHVRAVVQPGTLVEQWQVLQACVDADVAIIMQAANTGLTGGSTPYGEGYDRDIVIVNAMRIGRLDLIRDGTQVISLPGVTLDQMEKRLRTIGREPHSVIGSTCIGASVTGGICNNSGGSLIQRGPAYTQYALFAQVDDGGRLKLVNHLGVDLGETPEQILSRLDRGDYTEADITASDNQWASDREYCTHVRDVDADTPARFNADPRRLYEASGSAGKLAVFALRLDTFPAEDDTRVFYIGTNDKAELTAIRRHILSQFENLPVAGEYLHRHAYDMTKRYGKDMFLFIRKFGTDRIPKAFAAKSWVDGLTESLRLGSSLTDHLVQGLMALLPEHLPKRMNDFRDRYEHHLMIKMSGAGIDEARTYLTGFFPTAGGDVFECTPTEGEAAFLLRFAVGNAAGRYRATHRREIADILALDVAIPRNDVEWMSEVPAEIAPDIAHHLVCGHFFCHVFHEDYIVKQGANPEAIKARLTAALAARGAEYPAEHNVGHLYEAKPALREFYRELDPTNAMNPGIGKTSKLRDWA